MNIFDKRVAETVRDIVEALKDDDLFKKCKYYYHVVITPISPVKDSKYIQVLYEGGFDIPENLLNAYVIAFHRIVIHSCKYIDIRLEVS